jgi:ferritin-like metal-binding protein YciE
MERLADLFEHHLKDMYSAEKQLTKALPKMAKAASNPKLKRAIENHLRVTEEQLARLEKILDELSISPGRKKCAAMAGLIEEGEELLKEKPEAAVLDAGIIAAAQRVEHYEIAAYGTMCTYAKLLNESSALNLLKKTLDEEERTDKELSTLAESGINEAAIGEEVEEEEDDDAE